MKGRQGRRRKQLLYVLQEKQNCWILNEDALDSILWDSLWKRPWTCLKTDYGVNECLNEWMVWYYYILRYELVPLVCPADAGNRVILNVVNTYTEPDFTALHPRRQHPTKHSVLCIISITIFYCLLIQTRCHMIRCYQGWVSLAPCACGNFFYITVMQSVQTGVCRRNRPLSNAALAVTAAFACMETT